MTTINTILFWIILALAAMGWIVAGLLYVFAKQIIQALKNNLNLTVSEIIRKLKL